MAQLDADLLDHAEIHSLIRACSRRAPTGIRNATLIAVLWRSGLRITEALSLRLKDIDLQAQTMTVQRGKVASDAPSASTNKRAHS